MQPNRKFKNLRKESGLSQSRLSLAAGYDHSYVSRIENGTRRPSPEALQQFIAAMGFEGEDKAYELMDAYGYVTDRHILASPLIIRINERIQTEEGFEHALRSVIGN